MKQYYITKIFCFACLISFLGCQEPQKSEGLKTDKKFYDLKNFFLSEIKRHTEGGTKIEKTVKVNGKTEMKTIEKPNFEAELADFAACDINRPAWRDKYTEINQANHINITALDKNMKIKSINIARGEYEIFIEDKSPLTHNKQNLYYNINGVWSIKKEQKFVGSAPEIIEMQVRPLPQ
jgi:hypothetical protein